MERFFLTLFILFSPCTVLADAAPGNAIIVKAESDATAELVGREAKFILTSLRKEWARENSKSVSCLRISVSESADGANGVTSYYVDGDGGPRNVEIEVTGNIDGILNDVLPRQLSHVVVAEQLDVVPRWVEMGVGLLSEGRQKRKTHWRALANVRDSGKLMPTGEILAYTLYPTEMEDIKTMYVQAMGLAEFIIETWDREVLLAFAADTVGQGNEVAVQKHLGFNTVGDFDLAFRQWLAGR